MDLVFANKTCIVGSGHHIVEGRHWPADDPVVLAYPEHFTDDPRFGLASSRPLGDDGYPLGATRATETTSAGPGEKRSRTQATGK